MADPNIDINDLWTTEEVEETETDYNIADMKNQKLNVSFLRQAYDLVEASGYKGISQMELASKLGVTKLISRTLVRNLVKTNVVSTYVEDIGRQRTTKYVSKKLDDKNTYKKRMEDEITKIKEYSRSLKIEKCSDNEPVVDDVQNCNESIIETSSHVETENPVIEDVVSNDERRYIFNKTNFILKKYKLLKKKRYFYTSLKNRGATTINGKKLNVMKKFRKKNHEINNINKNTDIFESDFYKTIESTLKVQKPKCKKKSKKNAVTGIMEDLSNYAVPSNISYRLIRRANMIVGKVQERKVLEDTQELMKVRICF